MKYLTNFDRLSQFYKFLIKLKSLKSVSGILIRKKKYYIIFTDFIYKVFEALMGGKIKGKISYHFKNLNRLSTVLTTEKK